MAAIRPESRRPDGADVVIANTDGFAEPNPGLATYGWIVRRGSSEIASGKGIVGTVATNNEAEYASLIAALEWAVEAGVEHLTIKMDSNLVVNQVTGKWRCKTPNLQALHAKVAELASNLDVSVEWVPRDENTIADELSRRAWSEHAGNSNPEGKRAARPRIYKTWAAADSRAPRICPFFNRIERRRCGEPVKRGHKFCPKHVKVMQKWAAKQAPDVQYNDPSSFSSGYSKHEK